MWLVDRLIRPCRIRTSKCVSFVIISRQFSAVATKIERKPAYLLVLAFSSITSIKLDNSPDHSLDIPKDDVHNHASCGGCVHQSISISEWQLSRACVRVHLHACHIQCSVKAENRFRCPRTESRCLQGHSVHPTKSRDKELRWTARGHVFHSWFPVRLNRNLDHFIRFSAYVQKRWDWTSLIVQHAVR